MVLLNAYMKFIEIDGIHLLRFSAFDCAGFQVGWDEANYPIDCEDYLIEREFRRLKRCHPDSVDLLSPVCMTSQTSTILHAQPILLVVESL